ncbi:MAG: tRNA preQ1(34) S-adenosylmethionine ribosyltransferase-isomerase QueA [Anaerolineales bacterium]|nr:tRNA preQ1(34) S-adenosylmethionine ribosyltransferase-isomerase QueA [Anaerolineales bacterium]
MKTSDFDYELPEGQIAQTPIEPRDSSRLLILNRKTVEIQHEIFRNITQYLFPGDLLVMNQSRVTPARLHSQKLPGGGKVEVLLLSRRDDLTWEVLVGGKGIKQGRQLRFSDSLQAEVVNILDGPRRLIRFNQPVDSTLDQLGEMPLPPYIHTRLEDPDRYQTVYAKESGSAAAPTAGLHFTQKLLEEIRATKINLAYVTLHVGLDTFAPVKEDNPAEHAIHTEWCTLSEETSALINQTKSNGNRVIAVGTTSVRVLETGANFADGENTVGAFTGPTSLLILPGYQYQVVDAIITNFHLPRSTLLMMISAFVGREQILKTYQTAIQEGYRFFSFGDAMFIQ